MTEGEIQALGGGIFVKTSKNHTFGTDAFLLSYFAAPTKRQTVCDLGTGCGIIPLVMAKDYSPKAIYGVDIQKGAIEQFEEGLEKSDTACEIHPICADLKELSGILPQGTFDVVTCNPPYKAANSGIESRSEAERIARHEVCCNQNDVCRAAAGLLKFGGKLCVCQRPERLADVICAMRENGIEPKRLQMVTKECGDAPWLFLLEGKKGGKPYIVVEKEFAIYNNGEYSAEAKALYRGCFAGREES